MVCLSFFFPFFFNKASSSISAVTFSDIAHVPKDNFIEVKERKKYSWNGGDYGIFDYIFVMSHFCIE